MCGMQERLALNLKNNPNLGLVFMVITIMVVSYNNFVLTKFISEIWECRNNTKLWGHTRMEGQS